MSECVVRIKTPVGCRMCPVRTICLPYIKWLANTDKPFPKLYDDGCLIICALPENHGRLVDADKLAEDMKARKAFFGRMSDPQCLVEDAPTVVPETEATPCP